MTMPIPTAIAATVRNFAQDIPGADATAEHLEGRRWRVTLRSARVVMSVDYDVRNRRQLRMRGSDLTIDGQSVPVADSYSQLIKIFEDPDHGRDASWQPPDPPEVSVDDAPAEVQRMYRKLQSLPPSPLHLKLRHTTRYWYLCLESDPEQTAPTDEIRLQVTFVDYVMNPQRPTRNQGVGLSRDPITLTIAGQDLTAQVQGHLDKALALITAHQGAPATPATPGISGPAPAAVNTGVQVRKQTVIRT